MRLSATVHFVILLAGSTLTMAVMSGCETSRERGDIAMARQGEVAEQRDGDGEREGVREVTSSLAFPTGERSTSAVMVQKRGPAEVRAGEPFEYIIEVQNLTEQPLEQVVVSDQPQVGWTAQRQPGAEEVFGYARTEETAEPGAREGRRWNLGTLGPGETRQIRVRGVAQNPGALQTCTTVSYQPTLCMTTQVIQPQIQLQRIAPEQADACEPIPIRYRVTNTGVGTARDIRVTEQLPEGMTHGADRRREVAFTLDELAQGESREFTVSAQVAQRGRYTGQAEAVDADGQRVQSEESITQVVQPELHVTVAAPERGFVERPVTYQVTISNRGDAPARDLEVRQTLPSGAELIRSSGQPRVEDEEALWQFEPLEPGQSRELTATVQADEPALLQSRFVASAYCARAVTGQVQTDLQGIAALLLEVVDQEDPVQLGDTETYTITVTNQGSREDRNVRIVATLPGEMAYVGAVGRDTAAVQPQVRVEGRQITFQIPSLAPQQSIELQVRGRAQQEGDVRFQVEMTSDSLTRPVIETESTELY